VARFVLGIGLAALALYVLNGHRGELTGATSFLANLSSGWVLAAVVAEFTAIVSFAMLQRVLLLAGGARVGFWRLVAITLAGNSINNSLPAGPAFATVFAYRQYRLAGADETLSAWTVVANALLASVALTLVAVAGLAVAGAESTALNLVGVTILTMVVAIGIAALVLSALWRRQTLVPVLRRAFSLSKRLFHVPASDPDELAFHVTRRLSAVRPTRGQLGAGLLYAVGNWVFDCGCLALSFLAVHADVPWRGLLLAYGAGQLAANLPLTPGGLGVVEGSLTIALVAYGGAEPTTVAAVLLYRIISFWTSLPVGWAAWGALIVRERRARSAQPGAQPEPEAVVA
jgi:putative heme transporter